nr:hypothetical protein I308_03178 [Cryptococcus tetragattii IND107]
MCTSPRKDAVNSPRRRYRTGGKRLDKSVSTKEQYGQSSQGVMAVSLERVLG